MRKLKYLYFILLLYSGAFALNAPIPLDSLPQNARYFLNQQKNLYTSNPEYQQKLRSDYLQYYFLPWNFFQTYSAVHYAQIQQSILFDFQNKPSWGENQQLHAKPWLVKIQNNMDLNHFPKNQSPAMTINPTNLRLLPTMEPAFGNPKEAGQGYPFDNLQASFLDANLPVLVLHTTQDGMWNFIVTPQNSFGWVQKKDIALVDKQLIQQWQSHSYVTAILAGQPIVSSQGQTLYLTRIGAIYPIIKNEDNMSYILASVKNENGFAKIIVAKVAQNAVQPWPILLSTKNIANLANVLIGGPYGWGGLNGYRDCSATSSDLFAAFAIWLPRHSEDQAGYGLAITLKGKTRVEKKQMILQYGIPFLTLINLNGHVLLYIGEKNNEPIVLHDVWGIHTRNWFGTEGRLVIGKTVITPLDLGHGRWNIPQTWLDEANSMTVLVNQNDLISQSAR